MILLLPFEGILYDLLLLWMWSCGVCDIHTTMAIIVRFGLC
jgi:hypothetical protein